MKQTLLVRTGALAGLALMLAASAAAAEPLVETPRNLIFMLGDGMGFAQVKAYRMYADDLSSELVEPLPMEQYLVGAVSTDSIRLKCDGEDCVRDPHGFTDSASSATAYATGHDTIVGHLSVTGEGGNLPTILEAARQHGKMTGLVVTSQLTHASPAAFCSHIKDRDQQDRIADQLFDLKWQGAPWVDVLLGGGRKHLQRSDRDLLAEFRGAGYQVAENRSELLAADPGRLLGLFADEGLPRAWDRGEQVPSLAEMTRISLDTLGQHEEGFFLFVEGSQIDWAGHKNSVPGVISEMEDFVAAIRMVLDFAASNPDTLVIITADHETGGMSLGRDDIYSWNAQPLKGVKRTPKGMALEFLAGTGSLAETVAKYVPFELTAQEIAALNATPHEENAARRAIAEVFNLRTLTGWSSEGHTGTDVPLYVTGPGSNHFHGLMQNEALGRVLWKVFLSDND